MKEAAEAAGVPILRSPHKTTRVISRYWQTSSKQNLLRLLAVHGVLVDIYGIGILITGQSGAGRSETALRARQARAPTCC